MSTDRLVPVSGERQDVLLGRTVRESVDALDRALAGVVFSRAGALVRVLRARRIRGVVDESPVIYPLTTHGLLATVTRVCRCLRWTAPSLPAIRLARATDEPPKPELQEVEPSDRVLSVLLSQRDWAEIRPLRAVTESPVLRSDGSVVQTAGYDRASGYLYAPNAAYLPVDPSPSQQQARAALCELREVFSDFPYASPEHAMVPVAALLSIVGRAAIVGPCPAFIFDATVRGSGKTLQGDVVHAIATGRRAPHATLAAQEEEREKTLAGFALLGCPVVFLDNVKGALGGPKLEATLTSTEVAFRVLGRPDVVSLQWSAVILVSGNNLTLTEDMTRRVLVSRLESPLEDPTTRTEFTHPELVTWAIAERARLLVAALTVLRSYVSHGRPDTDVTSIGEPYGAWSALVPAAIRFAGGADVTRCRASRESVASDDVSSLGALLAGWDKLSLAAGRPDLSAHQICSLLRPRGRDVPPDGLDDLREALESLCPPRGPHVEPRQLGYVLRRLRGRWISGASLIGNATGHDRAIRWRRELQNPKTSPAPK